MSQHLLEFSVQSFTANQLELKIKNVSGADLARTLTIELHAPAYLVSTPVNDAAIAAATNERPIGVASLAGTVTGPQGWSIWARRETSESTVGILLFNDLDQKGNDLATPVKLAAGAEFTIRIPLNPQANRASVNIPYSYQHGTDETDPRFDDKLELKSTEPSNWSPDVTLRTTAGSPTAIPAGTLVKVIWHVKDGVSATLRGPLPGGNSELTLSPDPGADFKIADGFIEVRVVSSMTFVLQAEVKRPDGQPNFQVVRLLALDTTNGKYFSVTPRPSRVLPNGLIEVDWAAWGVKQVTLSVGSHTTRTINLTQQTLGRFYEGSGVMRVSARKTNQETFLIESPPEKAKKGTVQVISWEQMQKSDIKGHLWGMAVIPPNIGLLTFEGLYVARVGNLDPSSRLEKLAFSLKTPDAGATEWIAITAVDKRFVVLRRTSMDLDVAPYTIDGVPDKIPPLSLPAELRSLMPSRRIIDLVGFGGRAYIVVEVPLHCGAVRRAYSVGFNSDTNKADYRPEPLLQSLVGFRLVTFDDALYAISRNSGRMFRFELQANGMLDQPAQAAQAFKKSEDVAQQRSMISQGLMVPVGRVLVVLGPSAVPSLADLAEYRLKNVLNYVNEDDDEMEPKSDLVYNPQKNYWARCGHDLDLQPGAVAAFRGGDSPRLWVIQPNGDTQTLAVGSETLFAHDYVTEFPTKPLQPYINKRRKIIIKTERVSVSKVYGHFIQEGVAEFSSGAPVEVTLPQRDAFEFPVEIKYNEADPAPVSIRFMMTGRPPAWRPDNEYMLELTLSGPDLATTTSSFRRLSTTKGKLTGNDEVAGSRKEHSSNSKIVVTRPKRLEETFDLMIVNAAKEFRLRMKEQSPLFTYILDSHTVQLNYVRQDFTLVLDGKVSAPGEIGFRFNYALPAGIEASSSSTPQTKLVRLATEFGKSMIVKVVKTLMPGDPPFTLEGVATPIAPKDKPFFICQLDYQP